MNWLGMSSCGTPPSQESMNRACDCSRPATETRLLFIGSRVSSVSGKPCRRELVSDPHRPSVTIRPSLTIGMETFQSGSSFWDRTPARHNDRVRSRHERDRQKAVWLSCSRVRGADQADHRYRSVACTSRATAVGLVPCGGRAAAAITGRPGTPGEVPVREANFVTAAGSRGYGAGTAS